MSIMRTQKMLRNITAPAYDERAAARFSQMLQYRQVKRHHEREKAQRTYGRRQRT